MKAVKNIFDFFINSSIWVALSVCALVVITCINHNVIVNYPLLLLIFSGTIVGYNFVKYFEKENLKLLRDAKLDLQLFQLKNRRQHFLLSKKIVWIMTMFAAVLCIYLLFVLHLNSLFILLIPMALTFFYAISFRRKSLRAISGVKIYVVGFVWAFVTVLFPLYEYGVEISTDVLLTFVQRLIFVVLLILPFEIRDLQVDDISLGTMPQRVGVINTKLYGFLLAMLFLCLEFFKDEVLEVNLLVLPLVFVISVLFLVFATEKQSKYYASFFVEGIPVFWLGLLLIL